jgi:uncharacterized membrane protein YqjE
MAQNSPDSLHFSRHMREWIQASLHYGRARLQLAGLEGKDALARMGGVLFLAIVAVTLSLAGYLLLCLSLVFGLARLWPSESAWIWIAAIVGVAQVAGAWGLLKLARSWMEKPMFPATLDEFRKDEAWLKSTAEKPN